MRHVRTFQRSFVAGLALKMDRPGDPLAPAPPELRFHAPEESDGGRP